MLLMSWNVNGIRAGIKKGFLETLEKEKPDLLFLQEIKAQVDQLEDDVLKHPTYTTYWNPAERKGYSGTALFSTPKLTTVVHGTGIKEFDAEGRVTMAEIGDFVIYGIYFPNGGRGEERMAYKMRFYKHMLEEFEIKKAEGKHVIITGDFNVAHQEIDLKHPKANVNTSGFLQIERDWFQTLLDAGYIDTFRHFYPDKIDEYSWWNQRFRARDTNAGWRIDYFVISEDTLPFLKAAGIRQDIMGSDHCPVWVEMDI